MTLIMLPLSVLWKLLKCGWVNALETWTQIKPHVNHSSLHYIVTWWFIYYFLYLSMHLSHAFNPLMGGNPWIPMKGAICTMSLSRRCTMFLCRCCMCLIYFSYNAHGNTITSINVADDISANHSWAENFLYVSWRSIQLFYYLVSVRSRSCFGLSGSVTSITVENCP